MRPVASPAPAITELGLVQYHHSTPPASFSSSIIIAAAEAPPKPEKCDARTCPWWPYSNSKDFKANTAVILIILFGALICGVVFNAAIRYLLRSCRRGGGRRHTSSSHVDQGEQKAAQERAQDTLVYSGGMKLAGGAEAECAICLSEFIEGEEIRVLGRCNHGFHVPCIQKWLSSHSSCPNCRTPTTCFLPSSVELTHQTDDDYDDHVLPVFIQTRPSVSGISSLSP